MLTTCWGLQAYRLGRWVPELHLRSPLGLDNLSSRCMSVACVLLPLCRCYASGTSLILNMVALPASWQTDQLSLVRAASVLRFGHQVLSSSLLCFVGASNAGSTATATASASPSLDVSPAAASSGTPESRDTTNANAESTTTESLRGVRATIHHMVSTVQLLQPGVAAVWKRAFVVDMLVTIRVITVSCLPCIKCLPCPQCLF